MRIIATSVMAFLFLTVGITGTLMFFHLFDDYTRVIHELLGLGFVLFIILHIRFNWKSLQNYFPKRIFMISGIFVFILAVTFGIISKNSKTIDSILINGIITSPITSSFIVLNKDFNQTKLKIESNGIIIGEAKTIEEISKKNHIPLKNIVELIIK